jgi:hypothetical protein
MNLLVATLLAILGQILTFIQIQVSYKYGWYEKYPLAIILLSIPTGWCYIKSVDAYIQAFNGSLWPARLIGFGIGVIIFTFMSIIFFNESVSLKTLICLILSVFIILIQIYIK